MNDLHELVERYLHVRRAMGFKLAEEERILKLYLLFLEEHRYPKQSLENSLEWARLEMTSIVKSVRLSVVKSFVRWAQTFDSQLELIPQRLLPRENRRAIPYIWAM